MGSPDLCPQPQTDHKHTPVLDRLSILPWCSIASLSSILFFLCSTMTEISKTETMHTERVEEAEGQEAHPKVALSTILAVFVSVWKGSTEHSS